MEGKPFGNAEHQLGMKLPPFIVIKKLLHFRRNIQPYNTYRDTFYAINTCLELEVAFSADGYQCSPFLSVYCPPSGKGNSTGILGSVFPVMRQM